jgi:hypothetical protein
MRVSLVYPVGVVCEFFCARFETNRGLGHLRFWVATWQQEITSRNIMLDELRRLNRNVNSSK